MLLLHNGKYYWDRVLVSKTHKTSPQLRPRNRIIPSTDTLQQADMNTVVRAFLESRIPSSMLYIFWGLKTVKRAQVLTPPYLLAPSSTVYCKRTKALQPGAAGHFARSATKARSQSHLTATFAYLT